MLGREDWSCEGNRFSRKRRLVGHLGLLFGLGFLPCDGFGYPLQGVALDLADPLACQADFLTDFLEGDHYFKTARENHNLERCRNQFILLKQIEDKEDELQQVVLNLTGEVQALRVKVEFLEKENERLKNLK